MIWLWIVLAIGFATVELVMLKKYAAAISLSSLIMAVIYHATERAGNRINPKLQLVLFVIFTLAFVTLAFLYNKFHKK